MDTPLCSTSQRTSSRSTPPAVLAAPTAVPLADRGVHRQPPDACRRDEEASVVVLIADGVVERRHLSGEKASELVIPIDGVGQVDVERREVDLEGRKLVV